MITPHMLIGAAHQAGLGACSIVLRALDPPGWTIETDREIDLYPASMIKVPLAVAVAVAVSAGRLNWTDRLCVGPANLTFNDAPSPLTNGVQATVDELVDLMLARSDNVATNMLIDRIERRQANAQLAALGFARTAIRRKLSGSLPLIIDPDAIGRNAHPAPEAAALFAQIADRTVPGAERIGLALEAQHWNTKLSLGLIAGDRFAHKTGDTDEVSHDGGILTLSTGRRYVFAVYTALSSTSRNDAKFGTFMRILRPALAA